MNTSSTSIRNLICFRGLVALAIVALLVLGATRDVRGADNGAGTAVVTSAVIACEAMGGKAEVDTVLDQLSQQTTTPVLAMRCKGGTLDGFTCDGLSSRVKCGSTILAAGGSSQPRTPVSADKER